MKKKVPKYMADEMDRLENLFVNAGAEETFCYMFLCAEIEGYSNSIIASIGAMARVIAFMGQISNTVPSLSEIPKSDPERISIH